MIIVSPLVSSEEELLDVANDTRRIPTVEESRPASCPLCGGPAHIPGKPLGIVGHGSYVRKVRGVGTPASTVSIRVRRYRCRHCPATIGVLPPQLHPRQRFAADAIFDALGQHLVERKPAREIRGQITGRASASGSWRTLHRWRCNLLSRLWSWLGARLGVRGPARSRREARRRFFSLAAEKQGHDVDLTLTGTVHCGGYCWRLGQAPPEKLATKHLRDCAKEHPQPMSVSHLRLSLSDGARETLSQLTLSISRM